MITERIETVTNTVHDPVREMNELKPQSHQAYDQVTTYLRPKNGAIVERTCDWSQRSYDWSQRSWAIARGKLVATRSMVMFKT